MLPYWIDNFLIISLTFSRIEKMLKSTAKYSKTRQKPDIPRPVYRVINVILMLVYYSCLSFKVSIVIIRRGVLYICFWFVECW